MKKWLVTLLIIIIIIIVALLLLPYGIGKAVQTKYPTLIESQSNPQVQLKILDYKRGWFSSDATVRVTIKAPGLLKFNQGANNGAQAALASTADFIVFQHILHGPLLFTTAAGNTKLLFGQAYIISNFHQLKPIIVVPNSAVSPAVPDATNSTPASTATASSLPMINFTDIHATALINFDGDLINQLRIPEVSYQDPQAKFAYDLKNMLADFTVTAQAQQVNGLLRVDAITLQSSAFELYINQIKSTFNLQKSPEGLYVGNQNWQLGQIEWVDLSDKQKVMLQNFATQSISKTQAGKLNYELNANLAAIVFDGTRYGPNTLALSINNLDVPTLVLMRQQLSDLNAQSKMSMLQLAKYNQLGLLLLSKGIDISVKQFNIATAWGVTTFTGNLSLPVQQTPTLNPLLLLNSLTANVNMQLPMKLVQSLLARFNVWVANNPVPLSVANTDQHTAPSVAAEQAAQKQISEWVASQWLIPAGANYDFSFSYKNKQALINGKAVNNAAATPVIVPATDTRAATTVTPPAKE